MNYNSKQEKFWAVEYAEDYIKNNEAFDHELGAQGWGLMLDKIKGNIGSYLECGCNIGRNIEQLNRIIPDSKKSIIEISEPAYNFVTKNIILLISFMGPYLIQVLNHRVLI